MENNLEVAGVEAAEKVLFATHYLLGPARAWWNSAHGMNDGQMMTWEDFKLKFSRYHVPPGLIKKMRDEFRELQQGRMSVVEYRDRFLTLSRYEEGASIARGGEEQLENKLNMELDMELDMKISHGHAREEREACAKEEEVQAGSRPGQTGRHAGALGPRPGPTGPHTG
ncbi:hypothetical protein QYE76_002779 [Lolium multiflorum]|uniref:Retrotransposon gag domain-containing protein n=1 Tax=Lolium multiflorum TaxID=4521 RepID=A0AAD8RP04_LOLMU|nr:hypothetical protein QYE76_002779 [Lolium multiflorum]